MKQGNFLTKTVMWLFFFAIVAYLGVYLADALLHPLQTELVYAYSIDRGVSVSGMLVRDERPIASDAELADILPAEGERIGTGQTLARIYSDRATLDRERDIEEITQQLEQLSHFSGTDSVNMNGKDLEESIAATLAELRQQAARKRLTELEGTAYTLKNLIFQRDFVYFGSDGITEMAATLKARRTELEKLGAGRYTTVEAPEAGTFSALVDGWEERLTPAGVRELTPAEFKAVCASGSGAAQNGYLGKLIRGSKWYFAFLLPEAEASGLKAGGRGAIRFERDFMATIEMDVESVSEAQDGTVLVLLSADRYLSETTLLRLQTAELITTRGTGLRLPKEAVRVAEDGTIGVYCVAGLQAKYKQVEIVYEGDSFYLVKHERANPAALREGDEVIVSGEGLYDGKVIAE